ncbi:methyltransferase [Actinoplanes sp. NPDC049548]|uniref:methyltransferase n=1 Tax=Actinoplanes sp. NPDC049548 TaxID=3155152 RepID=UPI00342FE725
MTTTDSSGFAAVMRIREIAMSAGYAAALRAAAQLKIADAFEESADVAELAAAVNAEPDALGRLLRALVCHGVLTEDEQGRFHHTDLSLLLRDGAPRSLRHMVLWATEPWTWEMWGHLDKAVRTGKGISQELYGKEFFTYLHEDAPESAEVFDQAMTQSSRLSAKAVAATLDLSSARKVVDIAGGQGHTLATVLEQNPHLEGVLFDLPDVVANADGRLRTGGELAGRVALVAGDCRNGVDVDADVYILKNILEWDDDSTVTTLRNVAAKGRPGARVIVIENLLDGSPEMKFTTAMDLLLLLNVDGRKHTKDGLVGLVKQAGLQVQDVRPAGPYLHLIESTIPAR